MVMIDWTWPGNVFQTIAVATGNKRRPTVVRQYDGTNSSSVDVANKSPYLRNGARYDHSYY